MLYDPKWEQQTKADPLKIETLIAWLEKQPASLEYCYEDTAVCLLAQYFAFTEGREVARTGTFTVGFKDGNPGLEFDVAWHNRIAGQEPFTFGAALDRASKLAAA